MATTISMIKDLVSHSKYHLPPSESLRIFYYLLSGWNWKNSSPCPFPSLLRSKIHGDSIEAIFIVVIFPLIQIRSYSPASISTFCFGDSVMYFKSGLGSKIQKHWLPSTSTFLTRSFSFSKAEHHLWGGGCTPVMQTDYHVSPALLPRIVQSCLVKWIFL